MGTFHKNNGNIQEFEVRIQQDTNGIDRVYISIITDIESSKYWIVNDERHSDLNLIQEDIHNALDLALNNIEKSFSINEYEERTYLFVKDSNGLQKQYTGKEIKK
jgi:hypothetical protein